MLIILTFVSFQHILSLIQSMYSFFPKYSNLGSTLNLIPPVLPEQSKKSFTYCIIKILIQVKSESSISKSPWLAKNLYSFKKWVIY
jgi:hypothetical protein